MLAPDEVARIVAGRLDGEYDDETGLFSAASAEDDVITLVFEEPNHGERVTFRLRFDEGVAW